VDTEPAPTVAASDDPGEAAYMAGYTLWNAKKFPEAQAALAQVVAKYPRHKRASYAQNLLGRAYLDGGKPALAAQAFASNYQTNPRGERAPDSLYYLGVALTRLNKNPEACKVYAEFDAAYGTSAEASLKDKVATGRKAAQCK
jgi:TolA-binding protein